MTSQLFTNVISIDFSDAESLPAVFEMDVKESDVTEDNIQPLRVAKFSGIDSITLFVESSQGGDVTALSSVKFFGETLQGTNMNELKKC